MATGDEARTANAAGGDDPHDPATRGASANVNAPGDRSDTGDAASAATDGDVIDGATGKVVSGEAADAPDGEPTVATDDPAADELSPQARLEASEAIAQDRWDRLLRLQAEMENQRKRSQRDVENARKFAVDRIIADLLPVKDSLELGLAAAADEGASVESISEGAQLTLQLFSTLLQKHNVEEIDPVGEKFDPEFQQAMSMQAIEGATPNTVVSVMQKGYVLNGRLVRPALVVVAR